MSRAEIQGVYRPDEYLALAENGECKLPEEAGGGDADAGR